MYLFVSGTHFASFYDFSIVIWNCSDRVVLISEKSYIKYVLTRINRALLVKRSTFTSYTKRVQLTEKSPQVDRSHHIIQTPKQTAFNCSLSDYIN